MTGDVSVNNRKAKCFLLYELEIKIKFCVKVVDETGKECKLKGV